ncbi:MAG TPA: glycerol-3-phosphate 1-O-acyltransferase PlsY [Candidatus Latescibacteria bacterium]|nr:glycerol-3-phosphate 1-O-acyltransferase PlsY [Candidatus Latescibacterota bacterium]HOS64608.1 glycerol-3-phosphate 1-O-acyltransferase PlsY [Candidatus Latescibacterota bacterium]HPK73917.1 glycerol-3-phosphate 1-O-acyltransferase PlsY [Candidatus Latescibacterota bacterium]
MSALLLASVLSYLLGAFPTAIVVGKLLRGIDVRDYGSRNAGATNVWRVLGAGPALFVLAIDALKGAGAVLLIARIASDCCPWDPLTTQVICGMMAVVGHIWTVFAGFRGGKGVGTGAGVFAALAPWCVLIALVSFVAVVALTRYISAGSITAAFVLAAGLVIQRLFFPESLPIPVVVIGCVVAVVVIVKHRTNIQRLINGTENRFGKPASAALAEKEGHRS